uniref:Uncharacterized protein n=1 Tax=Anopheles marajoara TaxID=58244 RepID=A0A2M4C3H1_9DIPT
MSAILRTPSCSVFSSRNTAACVCIVFCMLRRSVDVGMVPLALRTQSRLATDSSPAFAFRSCTFSPGRFSAAIVLAQARPNTTRSSNELAPSRLAPCTDEQAASPQAYSPGTTRSAPFSVVSTCPL